MTPSPEEVTQLLKNWRNGDQSALDKLMPLVYDELHRMAHRYMRRERAGHTLQTSALVNEAYLRLVGQRDIEWQNRAHFFAVAAQVMRRLLVDYARGRKYAKRGGDRLQVTLDEKVGAFEGQPAEVLAVHEALEKLAVIDHRKSQLVELRYFGGMSVEETAEVLGVSGITVKREWLKAKAWLYREINRDSSHKPDPGQHQQE
jgi:RNA polymerase sigma-70 factor (ECF subfamily)